MFGLASGIYQSYFGTPQLNVLLLGGESVGKTTLLERLKVTQFSKKGPIVKRSFSCPAPPKYANAKLLQDHDDDDDHDGDDDPSTNNNNNNNQHSDALQSSSERVQPSKRWLDHKEQSSLEDVDDYQPAEFGTNNQRRNPSTNSTPPPAHTSANDMGTAVLPTPHDEETNQPQQEFNLKPGAHMLPLQKIRPTSGQNLAKIDICGAKCHIFDISGKFMDLWERYYGDAEAVIFCWRVDYDAKEQRQILESVRQEIPDDVPILIFAHVFPGTVPAMVLPATPNEMTTLATELFLPNYHSNMMFAISGSATNGQGVREAMEWLIPLAKRQAKLRAQEAATAADAAADTDR